MQGVILTVLLKPKYFTFAHCCVRKNNRKVLKLEQAVSSRTETNIKTCKIVSTSFRHEVCD